MLRIAGITPFSTVDWPGKLACVAFCAGCPWRCPYCQNHALWHADSASTDENELYALLEQRHGLLDGVVLSGGEPLAQPGVLEVAMRVRELGFMVGLHTCGAFPGRLHELLPYLDWVGLDVKAPWDSYDAIARPAGGVRPAEVIRPAGIGRSIGEDRPAGEVLPADVIRPSEGSASHTAGTDTAASNTGALVRESLDVLPASNVELEVRTTWHPRLLAVDDVARIGEELASRGVRTWAVQAYRHVGTTGELINETVFPSDVPAELPPLFEHFEFRRA